MHDIERKLTQGWKPYKWITSAAVLAMFVRVYWP